MRRKVILLQTLSILTMCAMLVAGCKRAGFEATGTPPSSEETQAGLPNPAAVYCEEQGGKYDILANDDGSQYGVCIFEDGSQCDEWAFYRSTCSPGSEAAPAPTTEAETVSAPVREGGDPGSVDEPEAGEAPAGLDGIANPAAVYCEEQGGLLEIKSDEAGNQFGVCILEDGSECDEWAYFLGECGPAAVSAQEVGNSPRVYGWYGLITSTGETGGHQLVLLPEGAGAVDLTLDPTTAGGPIATALAAARDDATPVHVWGDLNCETAPCQLKVTKVVPEGAPDAVAPDRIEGWQGTVQTLPPMAQFDDVFVLYHPTLKPQYGIHAPDPAVAAKLESLHDTGRAFFVFGELTCNVIDVNGCQIQVERLEFRE